MTQKLLKKKPKKGSKNAKPITKTENCESFFNFFNPPQVPEEDEDIDEDAVCPISFSLFEECFFFFFWVCALFSLVFVTYIFFFYRLRSFKTRWNKIMTLGNFVANQLTVAHGIVDSHCIILHCYPIKRSSIF